MILAEKNGIFSGADRFSLSSPYSRSGRAPTEEGTALDYNPSTVGFGCQHFTQTNDAARTVTFGENVHLTEWIQIND